MRPSVASRRARWRAGGSATTGRTPALRQAIRPQRVDSRPNRSSSGATTNAVIRMLRRTTPAARRRSSRARSRAVGRRPYDHAVVAPSSPDRVESGAGVSTRSRTSATFTVSACPGTRRRRGQPRARYVARPPTASLLSRFERCRPSSTNSMPDATAGRRLADSRDRRAPRPSRRASRAGRGTRRRGRLRRCARPSRRRTTPPSAEPLGPHTGTEHLEHRGLHDALEHLRSRGRRRASRSRSCPRSTTTSASRSQTRGTTSRSPLRSARRVAFATSVS